MTKTLLLRIALFLVIINASAQTNIVTSASGDWKSLIKLENFLSQ